MQPFRKLTSGVVRFCVFQHTQTHKRKNTRTHTNTSTHTRQPARLVSFSSLTAFIASLAVHVLTRTLQGARGNVAQDAPQRLGLHVGVTESGRRTDSVGGWPHSHNFHCLWQSFSALEQLVSPGLGAGSCSFMNNYPTAGVILAVFLNKSLSIDPGSCSGSCC